MPTFRKAHKTPKRNMSRKNKHYHRTRRLWLSLGPTCRKKTAALSSPGRFFGDRQDPPPYLHILPPCTYHTSLLNKWGIVYANKKEGSKRKHFFKFCGNCWDVREIRVYNHTVKKIFFVANTKFPHVAAHEQASQKTLKKFKAILSQKKFW